MFLLPFDRLPRELQCGEVKKYYDILDKKRPSLFMKRLMDIFLSLVMIVVLLILLHFALRSRTAEPEVRSSRPWWMWVGGLLGAAYILANIRLSGSLGPGLAIIILLIGSTAGSVLVDQFGWFGAERKPMNLRKAAGLVCMTVGAVCIRLL